MVLSLALGALLLLSYDLRAQSTESGRAGVSYIDSVETASREEAQAQKEKDATTIADYQHDRRATKAKAKEAQRVEKEANTAARESRYALRAEKRAQKARKSADRQAEKASRARVKSDRN